MKDLNKQHIHKRPAGAPEGSIPCKRCNGTGVVSDINTLKWTYCPDCKGFGFLTSDEEIISIPMRLVYAWRTCLMPMMIVVLGFVIAFLILAISPNYLLSFLLKGAATPNELLQAYSDWYTIQIILLFIVTVFVFLIDALAWHIQVKPQRRAYKSFTILFIVIYTLLYFIVIGSIVLIYDIPTLCQQSKEDLKQMENGKLNEVEVWLYPESSPASFEGVFTYTKNPPKPLTKYLGISYDTGGEWVEFYVPNCLDFSLNQYALYNENQSIL